MKYSFSSPKRISHQHIQHIHFPKNLITHFFVKFSAFVSCTILLLDRTVMYIFVHIFFLYASKVYQSSVRNRYLHVNGDVGPNELAASNRKLVSPKHEQVISRNKGNLQKNRVTPYIACTRLNLVGGQVHIQCIDIFMNCSCLAAVP